jgi:putative addiction module component (TIGR02574 family)
VWNQRQLGFACGKQNADWNERTHSGFRGQVVREGIILGMTQDAHELLQKALALPENERAELAGNLIASLDATIDQDADAAWQQEVVRRLGDVRSGKVETVSWEEVQQKGRTLLHDK